MADHPISEPVQSPAGVEASQPESLLTRLERLPSLPFHRLLASLLGCGLLFDGFDTLVMAVTLVAVLNTFHVSLGSGGVLVAAGFVGQMIGALLFGYFSEVYGRKITFVFSLLWFGLVSLIAVFAPSFLVLLLLRFLQGLGLGGCPPVATALFNEYIPGSKRGKNGLFVQVFFAGGYMLAPFLAIVVFALAGPALGWRVLFGIGALPILFAVVAARIVPESVRWLEVKQRTEEAGRIVTSLEQEASRLQRPLLEPLNLSVRGSQQPTRLAELFSPRYRRRTLLTWTLWFAAFFILVGFSSWLPTLYITPGGLSQQQSLILTFVFGFGTLGMLALFAFTNDQLGRRTWFLIGFLLASLGAASGGIAVGWFHATGWIALATAGLLMSMGAYVCVAGIYLYASELYPTRMRAWAIATGRSWSALASIVAPLLIGVLINAHLGITSIFVLLLIMALAGLLAIATLGEETKQQVLEALAS